MYADSRKIHIIEAVLKTEDEKILSKLEDVIEQITKPGGSRSAKSFLGRWSNKDAATIEKIIEEDCEQIYPDDWK